MDSEFVKIASKQKLDLTPRFEAIFGGAVKISEFRLLFTTSIILVNLICPGHGWRC